jgi:cytochrome c peroxidase
MRTNKTVNLVLIQLFLVQAVSWADALPKKAPVPKDNPMTPAKITLGKQLYFDPRLSKDNSVSCNSCHNVMGSGTDNLRFSKGVGGKEGGRNSPTVWNAAFMSVQFWDGRAATLEEQAKGPLINPVEMAMENHDAVVAKLKEIPEYKSQFEKVFGKSHPITIDHLAQAIAAYERTLITPNSPYDRFMSGNKDALSPSAQRGMKLTQSVGCVTCHNGPNFAGPKMPVGQGNYKKFPTLLGTDYEMKYELATDLGRYNVTKKDEDKNMWRVPTWRNVALTAPYFHNGSVQKLDEAVRVMAKTQLNRDLKNEEVTDIVSFLESLTGVPLESSKTAKH